MKKNITVRLRSNSYPILISEGEKDFLRLLEERRVSKCLFIITDKNIAKLHLKQFVSMLVKNGYECKSTAINAGESGKSIASLSFLYDTALKEGIDRKSCVVALGGGVVGDVAGFFAATYMRGIPFMQVPTTLLAMTDSSVGGKTAVNTKGGKNIAGAFYQPSLVWINTLYLKTLPERHIRNGLAEVVKYAFIFDKNFYGYIKEVLDRGYIDSNDFAEMISKSCQFKAGIVEKDEKETKGLREVLNFGHTLAHALETYSNYKGYLHGEAVAIGMLFAAKLSVLKGLCAKPVYLNVKELLEASGFDIRLSGNIDAGRLVSFMKKDKKSVQGNIRFVLLKDIGQTVGGYALKDKFVESELKKFIRESA